MAILHRIEPTRAGGGFPVYRGLRRVLNRRTKAPLGPSKYAVPCSWIGSSSASNAAARELPRRPSSRSCCRATSRSRGTACRSRSARLGGAGARPQDPLAQSRPPPAATASSRARRATAIHVCTWKVVVSEAVNVVTPSDGTRKQAVPLLMQACRFGRKEKLLRRRRERLLRKETLLRCRLSRLRFKQFSSDGALKACDGRVCTMSITKAPNAAGMHGLWQRPDIST